MFETKRVLIWGKTYPELSAKHMETVCTGGCLEDGTPIRLYPIDLRYLETHQQYKLYNWIRVPLERNHKDPRPESFKVDAKKLLVEGEVGTADGWRDRRAVIFAHRRDWHYDCLDDLKSRQQRTRHSLGVVSVSAVKVKLERRPEQERLYHEEKLRELQSKLTLFGDQQKALEFLPYRIRIHWFCSRRAGPRPCPGHSASVLDWGLLQMARRDGFEMALARITALSDLTRYDLHLYVGNLFSRQHIFSVIGLWYPLRDQAAQEDLFIPSAAGEHH